MIFKIKNDWQRVAKMFWIYLVPEHVLQESLKKKLAKLNFAAGQSQNIKEHWLALGFGRDVKENFHKVAQLGFLSVKGEKFLFTVRRHVSIIAY